MKHLVSVLLFAALIVSCGTRKSKELQDPGNATVQIAEVFDTLIVDRNIAIIWWPDSIDQIIMKENYDEISYNTFVDDLTWYTQRAVEMLDSFNIDNRVTDKDIIILQKNDNSKVVLKRKETKGNFVLLNPESDPFVANVNEYNRKQVIDFFK